MKRCVIIGGAPINDYNRIKEYLSENDCFIYCDSGLKHESPLGFAPELIVGDFDSHDCPKTDCEIIKLPREKDDTDTFFAAKEALKRGFDDFLLVGVIGGRLDHSLCNVSILLYLESFGKSAKIIDDFSEMEIVSDNTAYIEDSFPYFSLIAIDGTAKKVSIKNAKFPLENAEITPEYQYGVSNEVTKGKTASVSVGDGKLLLIKIAKE